MAFLNKKVHLFDIFIFAYLCGPEPFIPLLTSSRPSSYFALRRRNCPASKASTRARRWTWKDGRRRCVAQGRKRRKKRGKQWRKGMGTRKGECITGQGTTEEGTNSSHVFFSFLQIRHTTKKARTSSPSSPSSSSAATLSAPSALLSPFVKPQPAASASPPASSLPPPPPTLAIPPATTMVENKPKV